MLPGQLWKSCIWLDRNNRMAVDKKDIFLCSKMSNMDSLLSHLSLLSFIFSFFGLIFFSSGPVKTHTGTVTWRHTWLNTNGGKFTYPCVERGTELQLHHSTPIITLYCYYTCKERLKTGCGLNIFADISYWYTFYGLNRTPCNLTIVATLRFSRWRRSRVLQHPHTDENSQGGCVHDIWVNCICFGL